MTPDFIIQLIQFLGGSAVMGIITLVINQINKRQEVRAKSIDDRVDVWQKIAEENKQHYKEMEAKLANYQQYNQDLQAHVSILEQLLVRSDPLVELPKRPVQGSAPNT